MDVWSLEGCSEDLLLDIEADCYWCVSAWGASPPFQCHHSINGGSPDLGCLGCADAERT